METPCNVNGGQSLHRDFKVPDESIHWGEACSKDLLFPERLDDWIEEGRAAGCGSAAKLRDHALLFLPNVSERRQLLGCLGVALSRAGLAKVKLAGDAPYLYEK